jgi:hypothetical protein
MKLNGKRRVKRLYVLHTRHMSVSSYYRIKNI